MSTNVRYARQYRRDRTTSDATTATEESSTDARSAETGRNPSTARSTGENVLGTSSGTGSHSVAASDSWTRRCQRQFDPGNRDRLANLVDEENLVVVSPGAE
mgnify:CR=1 FL=1